MVSNHRLVLFTHALCRLSYPATLRTTAPGFKSRWFRDQARRSEQSSCASPTPLQSHLPWSGNHGPSRASGSRLLSKTRYPLADGRCLLVGGNTRHSALRGPLPPAGNARRFVRFPTNRNFFDEIVDRSPKRSISRGLPASDQILEAFPALANVRVLVEIGVVEEGFDAYEPHPLPAFGAGRHVWGNRWR